MIEDRLNSCSCFRSNVFKGLGLDSKGGTQKNCLRFLLFVQIELTFNNHLRLC